MKNFKVPSIVWAILILAFMKYYPNIIFMVSPIVAIYYIIQSIRKKTTTPGPLATALIFIGTFILIAFVAIMLIFILAAENPDDHSNPNLDIQKTLII